MCSYVANEYSGIVHVDLSDCVDKMHPENHIYYEELYHALSEGYSECQYCLGYWGSDEAFEFAEIKRERKERYFSDCLVCGESRGIQRAHIVPRSAGGKHVMPLCPNHHWNYDHGLLTKEELKKVISWISKNHTKAMAHRVSTQYLEKRDRQFLWSFGSKPLGDEVHERH